MNIQLSTRSDSWGSPHHILDKVREVLGNIDLDPGSSAHWNGNVKAARFFAVKDDGLTQDWVGTVYVNPPGGRAGRHSKSGLFWQKLMYERAAGHITHAIFMAFSAESLQNTQGKGVPAIMDFPFCVPAKRLHFLAEGNIQPEAPSHSNVIVYVNGTRDATATFSRVFASVGKVRV